MSMTIRLIACLATVTACSTALAQAQKKLPLSVQKELGEMMQMCKDAGGKALRSPGLLTIIDLSGDQLPDFVVDQASFVCEGAASLFGGSGGSQVTVYVGKPDGQASQAFSSGTFGVKVDKDSKPAKLMLVVSGPMCGQKVTPKTSRSDYKSCWRPVVWNSGKKAFDYAPLSQITPVQ